ncbi:MAG TPA: hypothetical protein VF625_08895 [Longimicrobium sp.]|jgi:inosine-uridine nucleoside N-ribohydrolase
MFEIIGIGLTAAAAIGGYIQSRRFVRNRLRFVDRVQSSGVPVLAGAAAAAVAFPITWIVPLVGIGTAALFGIGVGAGVAHGRGDIRNRRLGSGM